MKICIMLNEQQTIMHTLNTQIQHRAKQKLALHLDIYRAINIKRMTTHIHYSN